MVNATTNVTNTQTRKGRAIAYNPLDKKTPIRGPMSDADHARMVEFCCPQCLASVMGRDDDPIPKCARCRISKAATVSCFPAENPPRNCNF